MCKNSFKEVKMLKKKEKKIFRKDKEYFCKFIHSLHNIHFEIQCRAMVDCSPCETVIASLFVETDMS